MGGIQRYVTNRLASTKVLQILGFWLSYAPSTIGFIRIVAWRRSRVRAPSVTLDFAGNTKGPDIPPLLR